MKDDRRFFPGVAFLIITLFSWHTQKTGCIDYQTKMTRAEKLVDDAILFFKKTSRNKACRDFTYDERWQDGSLMIFVDDIAGNRLVSHNFLASIWETDLNLKNMFGEPTFPLILEAAKRGGGWVPIFLLNGLGYTYVRSVEKNKRKYIIGTGIFCDYEPDLVCRLLLKSIKRYWYNKNSIFDIFELISNSFGPCVFGNIYATVIDPDGVCWAHGNNTLLIGKNLLDSSYRDAPIFKKIVDFCKKDETKAGMIEAHGKTYAKKMYFRKIINPQTHKPFIVIVNYCPNLTQKTVLQVAENVTKAFKTNKRSEVFQEINGIQKTDMTLRENDCLKCMILDTNYAIRAYDRLQDSALIGRNYLAYVDQKERPFTQLIKSKIETEGKGWITRYSRNSLERIYAEKIETDEKPVILVIFGYYPTDKKEVASVLVDDAHRYLLDHPMPKTLAAFVQPDSPFIKGDVQVSLYDRQGFCWIGGLNKAAIWSQDTTWPQAHEGWVSDRRTKNELKRFKKNIGEVLPNIGEKFMLGATYFEDRPKTKFEKK